MTFESEKAGKIHAWYCSSCGGSFFDHWDSNLLTLEDIRRELSRVFYQENESASVNVEPECPLDQSAMHPVVSPAVPRQVKIFFCPFCHGNWFPRAELKKFKEAQEQKVDSFKKIGTPLSSVAAVFLPVLFFVILAGTTLVVRNGVMKGNMNSLSIQATEFQKMIHIKKIDDSSVEVIFFTAEPSKSVLNYKSVGEVLTKTENDFSRYHYLRINDLDNSDLYLFQIKSVDGEGKEYVSEWLSAK